MTLFGPEDKLQIIAFKSYGTDTHFYAKGRALEDEAIDLSKKGVFSLLYNSFKRFETDEVKHAQVQITFADGRTVAGRTDNRGYYVIDKSMEGLSGLTNAEGWLRYEIAYAGGPFKKEILHQNRFSGELLLPSKTADFGVISDIDDTILHTGVVSSLKWRVVLNTLFKTPYRRTPLKGASEFYNLLHRGTNGKKANPIFYVSHSPWNLYRYLDLFLQKNKFPKGPILLRNFPRISLRRRPKEKPQKQNEILQILRTYPGLPFILIGDSGEHDPDIYKEIAEMKPNRILAIYLRSVAHRAKMERVKGLFKGYGHTPVLLVESSQEAMAHAQRNGYL